MANELTLSASLAFLKGLSAASASQLAQQFSVAGVNFTQETQSISHTAVVALNLGGITTPGYIFIQNLDATNFVKIYDSTGGNACIKLKPLEFALFRCATTTPSAEADTAACIVQFLMIEN